MDEDLIEKYRYFLKDSIRKEIDFSQTWQNSGSDIPPIEKPYQVDAIRIDLVKPGMWKNIAGIDLITAIRNRQSRRTYTNEPLTLEENLFSPLGNPGCAGGSYKWSCISHRTLSRMPACL